MSEDLAKSLQQADIKSLLSNITEPKKNRGIRHLINEWKQLLRPQFLQQDLLAGFTVACVAVPLSLAIALASGVSPATGLITAIVAGITCALFGGTPLAVSGPAAAMAVLVASVVQQFGLNGLLIVVLGAGILQLLSGLFGAGKFAKFVPTPVIMGFTAGIGAIILIGQLPRALGLPPPDQSQIFHVIRDLGAELKNTHFNDLALVLATLAIIFGLPKLTKRFPAPLVAVLLPSIAAYAFGLNEETIGEIPRTLPLPKFPVLPSGGYLELLTAAFMVYALASLETLLSSSAVDKIARSGKRHDPNQELIGQGLGNIVSAMFGGIPVTGVIARSALNVQSGAKTRRASIIHSLFLIGFIFLFAPLISKIPVSVLAGVLLSVALKMLNPHELIGLWKVSRIEAFVYTLTFFVIVFVDLIVGVQAGIVAALLIMAIQLGRLRTRFHLSEGEGPYRFAIDGSITFVSSSKIASLSLHLEDLKAGRGVIVDFSKVTSIDASGGEQIVELLTGLKNRGFKFALQNVSQRCQKTLIACDADGVAVKSFAVTESDVNRLLAVVHSSLDRLVYGVEGFRKEQHPQYSQLFSQLANQQNPHTLFITCCDSRIDPNLITSTVPGELFVVRNVGNIIPPYVSPSTLSEGAAIEFAVDVLGVKEIVVCGHSGCGAMKAILSPKTLDGTIGLKHWLSNAVTILDDAGVNIDADVASRLNARRQIENLITYEPISRKLAKGELRLHAWFYDIGRGELENWNEDHKSFIPVANSAILKKSVETTLGRTH